MYIAPLEGRGGVTVIGLAQPSHLNAHWTVRIALEIIEVMLCFLLCFIECKNAPGGRKFDFAHDGVVLLTVFGRIGLLKVTSTVDSESITTDGVLVTTYKPS